MYRNKYTLWYKTGHGGGKSVGDRQKRIIIMEGEKKEIQK